LLQQKDPKRNESIHLINRKEKAMNKPVKPIPDGMHTVTPHLVCAGAADAIEFYKKALTP